MALVEVKVPDIGDFDEVTVIELMVKVGDTVARRAVADHGRVRQGLDGNPVEHAGVVKELRVAMGDKVKEGSVVLMVEAAGDAAAALRQLRPQRLPPLHRRQLPLLLAAAATPAASGPVNVMVPDIGDFKDVAVIEVFVKPGDTIKVGAKPDHGRVRQGLDGDSFEPRRRVERAQGQGGRHGQHR